MTIKELTSAVEIETPIVVYSTKSGRYWHGDYIHICDDMIIKSMSAVFNEYENEIVFEVVV